MAVDEYLARGFTFELNTGTVSVPVWTEVKGIDTWSHSESGTDADTTTFDDDGYPTHQKASGKHSYTFTGKFQVDAETGDRDPGQEACEAWAEARGLASKKQFRITPDEVIGGDVTGPFMATCDLNAGGGGGNDDPTKWEIAVKVSGKLNP